MVPTFAKAMERECDGECGVLLLSEPTPLSVRRLPIPGAEPRVLLLCEFADCFVGAANLAAATEAERLAVAELAREAAGSSWKPVFMAWDGCVDVDSRHVGGWTVKPHEVAGKRQSSAPAPTCVEVSRKD